MSSHRVKLDLKSLICFFHGVNLKRAGWDRKNIEIPIKKWVPLPFPYLSNALSKDASSQEVIFELENKTTTTISYLN